MFDLTKEVKLDNKELSLYKRFQALVYVLAAILAVYFASLILFPTAYFTFSFLTPDSTKNSVVSPRDENRNFLEKGSFPLEKSAYFDTMLNGNYSKVSVAFTLNKKSELPEDAIVKVRKSYQAFLYPEGDPIGFKDGTLLKSSGNYFIVSNGSLRQFASFSTASNMEFQESSFKNATSEDLKFNPSGEKISDANSYPDGSTFRVGNDYYILKEQKLSKFVSENAFKSQYDSEVALEKNEDILKKYPASEEISGFGDGSLLSYGESVFIVSGGNILPVNDAATFTSMGYDWNDVIPASGDEISLYAKAKLFTINSVHPSGTVYKTQDDSHWFMVKDGQKHPLPSEAISQSWTKKNPVLVSSKSLEMQDGCTLRKETFSRAYSCEFSVENIQENLGKDYEFEISSANEMRADALNVEFKKSINMSNLKLSLLDMFNKIKLNYVPQAANQ